MKKNKTMRVTFIDNCSHGYFSFSKKDIETLGIAEKISGCSGLSLNRVYLEEDCDYALAYNAAKEKGIELIIKDSYNPNFQFRHSYKYSLFRWVPAVGDTVVVYEQEYQINKIYKTYFELIKNGGLYKLSKYNPFAKMSDVKK